MIGAEHPKHPIKSELPLHFDHAEHKTACCAEKFVRGDDVVALAHLSKHHALFE